MGTACRMLKQIRPTRPQRVRAEEPFCDLRECFGIWESPGLTVCPDSLRAGEIAAGVRREQDRLFQHSATLIDGEF